MPELKLDIVTFDVPYPPDYGGAIDVFYKIKALADIGVSINLHTFEYGRGQQDELLQFCKNVYYYQRRNNPLELLSTLPYIVQSRQSTELESRLSKTENPILLEGLHSCSLLLSPKLKGRRIWLRMHNIEQEYYKGLAANEKNTLKRIYFEKEAEKLERFEPYLNRATGIFAISPSDVAHFKSRFENVVYLPAFFNLPEVPYTAKKEPYVLYHGNITVSENYAAAVFLIEEVWRNMQIDLVIAGKGAKKLNDLAASAQKNNPAAGSIKIFNDPQKYEIEHLISVASVIALPAMQNTGIKLKLLHSLVGGGHVLVNNAMVAGTGLEAMCVIADTPAAFQQKISEMMEKPFSEEDFAKRRAEVLQQFDAEKNARLIAEKIWS